MASKTPKNDLLFHAGHRERLKQKFLDGNTSSAEKLELLLTYAVPRRDVRPVARALIQRFKNVYFVLHASYDDLINVPGVGKGCAMIIKLVHELFYVAHTEKVKNIRYLENEKFIRDYCREILTGRPVEEAYVLYLGENSHLLVTEMHTCGTIDETAFYPREILKRAISLNALSVILVHNHPMSENAFSSADVIVTEELENLLNQNNISLIDHYVVAANGMVFSLREMALLRKKSINKQ